MDIRDLDLLILILNSNNEDFKNVEIDPYMIQLWTIRKKKEAYREEKNEGRLDCIVVCNFYFDTMLWYWFETQQR